MFLHYFWLSSFHSHTLLQATLALSLVVSSLKSVCCDVSIFSAVMPRSPVLCLTWYRIPSYTHSGTQSMGTYLAVQLSTCWSFIFISYHIRPAAERVLKIGRQLTKLPVHGLAPIWHTVANFPVFCATMTWINCLLLQCISVYTFTYNVTIYSLWPSLLWRCWLGGRKGIRPVKNSVVGCWHGYLSGARCRLAYGPADATGTHWLLLQ